MRAVSAEATSQERSHRHRRIAVICPYGIGNLIMTIPALLALRRGWPGAEIHLVSLLPSTTQMLEDFPLLGDLYDELHEVRFPRDVGSALAAVRAIARLRARRPHATLVTFPSFSWHYNLLSFLVGSRERVGSKFPDSRLRDLFWLNNRRVPIEVGAHDVRQNLRLVSQLGTPAAELDGPFVARQYFQSGSSEKKPIVGLHTGCKREYSYKQWPLDRFAEVVARLLDRGLPYGLRLFFGPDEGEQMAFFRAQPWAERVEFCTGLKLLGTLRQVEECAVFLSNDSGLMHMATLTGCPRVLAIVGPSDPRRTGPFDPRAEIIAADLPCMPCSHTYSVASRHFRCRRARQRECLEAISVSRVVAAVEAAVAGHRARGE